VKIGLPQKNVHSGICLCVARNEGFLAQIEELILSMKVHKNHTMAFLSRILALG